jgi:hypothetical protein
VLPARAGGPAQVTRHDSIRDQITRAKPRSESSIAHVYFFFLVPIGSGQLQRIPERTKSSNVDHSDRAGERDPGDRAPSTGRARPWQLGRPTWASAGAPSTGRGRASLEGRPPLRSGESGPIVDGAPFFFLLLFSSIGSGKVQIDSDGRSRSLSYRKLA